MDVGLFNTKSMTVIHQSLHGYSNGHKLLATSRELPSLTRRQLLDFSDLSGPGSIEGFSEYITGYPLPEIACYAIAKTWYAEEMKRPGCVWTHTLLIDFNSLDTITTESQIGMLFQRPFDNFDNYLKPIHIKSDIFSKTSDYRYDFTYISIIYQELYRSSKPLVISATSSDNMESIVLGIWLQQWSRLRRNFTFCTGALNPRFFENKPFDLQVTPYETVRSFTRDVDAYIFVDTTMQQNISNDDKIWITILFNDAYSNNDKYFGDMIRKYGADLSPSRRSFLPLVIILLKADKLRKLSVLSVQEISELIDFVGRSFIDPIEANCLKTDLFGSTSSTFISQNATNEVAIFIGLSRTFEYQAYDPVSLQIHNRTKSFAQKNPKDAARLLTELLGYSITPLGGIIVSGLFEGIPAEKVLELSVTNSELIPHFVSRYPYLAANPILWNINTDISYSILEVLQRQNSVNWEDIIRAIVLANASDIIDLAIKETGYIGIKVILEHFAGCVDMYQLISESWRRTIYDNRIHVIHWINQQDNLPIQLFVALTHAIDITIAMDIDEKIWDKVTGELKWLKDEDRKRAAAFLFGVALLRPNEESAYIAFNTFQIVHNAQYGKNSLSHDIWRWLDPILPTLSEDRWWDKCERLRQAYINATLKQNWPISLFLNGISDIETFHLMIEYCKTRPDGKSILKSIRYELNNKPSVGYSFQRELISEKGWWKRLFN